MERWREREREKERNIAKHDNFFFVSLTFSERLVLNKYDSLD